MKLQLLGTAAAEGWPAPFCDCAACEEARRRGGPNIRSRSGALLDDDFKIDFNADTVMHMQRAGRSLSRLRTLVFTHQHSDHIIPSELLWMVPPFSVTPPVQPIAVYGNAQVLGQLHQQVSQFTVLKDFVELHRLKPLRAETTRDGDELLPLQADHVEGALVLRITRSAARGGKTLFYGHDSGLYPAETLKALAAGPALDIVLLDCTNGGQKTSNHGHMGVDGIVQMTEELRRRGAITPTSRIIATHFSHNGGLLHEELTAALVLHGIEVAFDGMLVTV
jgi:phosphoribosyl 1,2-cyclic phosphate phosphodiesterase